MKKVLNPKHPLKFILKCINYFCIYPPFPLIKRMVFLIKMELAMSLTISRMSSWWREMVGGMGVVVLGREKQIETEVWRGEKIVKGKERAWNRPNESGEDAKKSEGRKRKNKMEREIRKIDKQAINKERCHSLIERGETLLTCKKFWWKWSQLVPKLPGNDK